ncbi:MAG: NAD(P)-dependent oxidoreductase [Terricaulis sp.]
MTAKLLVTGASGFVGARVLRLLQGSDVEVIALGRHAPDEAMRPLARRWIEADVMEHGAEVIRRERPERVLHLAWDTRHGLYWHSKENLLWVAATARMIDAFAESGGQRFVLAGSCAEYQWGGAEDFLEDATPLAPATLYGAAKKASGELLLSAAAQFGFGAAIGRIFFCYGEGEHKDRFVSYICRQLARGVDADITTGTQSRDFMHADDVASGLIALLESDLQGAVNVCSGQARTLLEIADAAGRIAGAPQLIRPGARPERAGDPARIVGDSTRLRGTGWAPRVDLDSGIARLLRSFETNA